MFRTFLNRATSRTTSIRRSKSGISWESISSISLR